jgi:hypothetical protein
MPRTQAVSTAQVGAAPFFAGKNKIINGDFRINQRNFSSVTVAQYGFDRWLYDFSGGTVTYSAQTFTAGTAPVAGYEGTNFARIVTASQSTAGHFAYLGQCIEDVRTITNQTVTVSFWAKAGSGTPNVGVTLAQNFGTGGSAEVPTSPAVQAITTSWARYSFTLTLPSIAGKTIGANNKLFLYLFTSCGTTTSGAGYAAVGVQNATIDFWGVQVEAGSVATAFQTATGTIQGELAACQRYFQRYDSSSNANTYYGLATANTSTQPIMSFPLRVVMRTAPSFSASGANTHAFNFASGAAYVASSLSLDTASPHTVGLYATTGSGMTLNACGRWLSYATTSSYLEFSSEL